MAVQNTSDTPAQSAAQQADNINPKHYRQHVYECIEFTMHMNFNLGNAFKYIWRHKEKGGREDLEKAVWYLERQRDDSPKFKKLKCRHYDEMYGDLNDCGFDRDTADALRSVLFIAYYGNNHDSEDNFAWALACVRKLLAAVSDKGE